MCSFDRSKKGMEIKMINIVANILGYVMNLIYSICKNYGITILLFTIVTKVILFPINILVQKNSIKMVKMKPKIDELKIKYNGDKEAFIEAQIDLFEKEKYHPSLGAVPLLLQIPIILGLVYVVRNPKIYIENLVSMEFCGIDMAVVPTFNKYLIIPILALFATIILWLFENKVNVLQKEQSILNKLATGFITVGLTIYLVFLVPAGVGLYWIFSDILAIIQLYILNLIFPPKKYVDYEYLNRIKEERINQKEQNKISKKKSKYYYKKFFNRENIDNMRLVIYSEKSGFYKYFKGMIEYILNNSDIVIHYVTSDMNDKIFEINQEKIVPYYISTTHLIPLFMKLEADIVVMTTPDLQNFYLKRSIVRKDIEYIYLSHGIDGGNMVYNEGALDYYDTVFTRTPKQTEEIRAIEKLRNLKKKNIVESGFDLIDNMIKEYELEVKNNSKSERKSILIAPSWQEDNIMESCVNNILDNILNLNYKIIVRPHPEFIKRNPDKIKEFLNRYSEKINENFIIELDFSSNKTVYNADLLITDWSGIAFEYTFSTLKPTLFINTKMKVNNPNYKKIDIVPLNIELRDIIGKNIEKSEINKIDGIIKELIENQENYIKNNLIVREKCLYNLGKSAEVEGKYIIERLKSK